MKDNSKILKDSKYWDNMRDFRLSRTPFWLGVGVEIIASITPIILIWIFFGYDFATKSFTQYYRLPNPQIGYLILMTAVIVPIWNLTIVSIFFMTKVIKADLYTYSMGFIMVGIALILNGSWIQDWEANDILKLFIRFLIILFAGAIGAILGVILTSFARNYRYKIEEEDYAILEAYRAGKPVPSRAALRLKRADIQAKKRAKDKAELEIFKLSLDERLLTAYNEFDEKEKAKEDTLKMKLDAKEAKKRIKDQVKKDKRAKS